MSEKEKTRFHQMAEKDKKRYESEMANYNPPEKNTTDDKAAKSGNRKFKDPNAPKTSQPPFFWFSKDERPRVKESMPDSKAGDIAMELGKRWNEASADVRSKYEALAAKDKARYFKEVIAYKGKEAKGAAPSKKSQKNDCDESGEEDEEEAEEEGEEEEEEDDDE